MIILYGWCLKINNIYDAYNSNGIDVANTNTSILDIFTNYINNGGRLPFTYTKSGSSETISDSPFGSAEITVFFVGNSNIRARAFCFEYGQDIHLIYSRAIWSRAWMGSWVAVAGIYTLSGSNLRIG